MKGRKGKVFFNITEILVCSHISAAKAKYGAKSTFGMQNAVEFERKHKKKTQQPIFQDNSIVLFKLQRNVV